MTIPTPEAFMAQQADPEDDVYETQPTSPLVGISEHVIEVRSTQDELLRTMAEGMQTILAMLEAQDPTELQQRYDRLSQEYDDLEHKHQSLYELLADVEKIISKSTSKLANGVREAITAWRNPEVPAAEPDGGSGSEPAEGTNPEAIVPPAVQCPACTRYFADQALLDAHNCAAVNPPMPATPPAHDADVEEWRAFAGATLDGVPEGTVLERMNKSQIRTLLGIPHPSAAVVEGGERA